MSIAVPIGSASNVSGGTAVGASDPAPAGASLLPTPSANASDGLSAVYELLSKDRRLGLRHMTADVHNDEVARKRARAKAFRDLMDALAEANKGGFFHDLARTSLKVAQAATVVAAVAVAVGSGGALAPVAYVGAALSVAAFAQSETHYLQKLGMSDSAAAWTEVGMSVGGAVGTGIGGIGAEKTTAIVFSRVAAGGAGAATAAGGVATWQAAVHDSRAKDHQADATAAKGEEDHLDRLIRMVLDDLDQADKQDQRTLDSLRGAIQGKGEALVLASRRA